MAQSRPININSNGKEIYFASDQHFGAPNEVESKKREAIFIQWLEEIKDNASHVFLLGDLFDFWFEYKHVIPKGFVRVLGKLAELSDAGIQFYFFTGNHDMWMEDYLEIELNFTVFREKQDFIIDDKNFLIAHGDGLGPGDTGYKRMKKVFSHPLSNWLYKWLHPDLGIPIGNYLSRKNKMISGEDDVTYLGEEKEWLVIYSKEKLKSTPYDYFVYGHRHLPLDIKLNEKSTYINLGDWITYFTFGKLKNGVLSLEKFK